MAGFSVLTRVQNEGEGQYQETRCEVVGFCEDNDAAQATLELRVTDQAGHEFQLHYLFAELDGRMTMSLPAIPANAANYVICVSLKVSGSVASAAFDCYRSTKGWRAFLDCMKKKAPGIGLSTISALFTCLAEIAG